MLRESDDQDPYNLTFGGSDDQGSNKIIEYEFDTHGNIIDLNVIYVPEVDMMVDKIEEFQRFLIINKLKIKKFIMHFEMH